MQTGFSVQLAKIIKELSLETIYLPENPEEILVVSVEVNRPGLQLAGYYEFFDSERVQVIGKSEDSYLNDLSPEKLHACLDKFFSKQPPMVIISRNLAVLDEMLTAAKKYGVPLLRTPQL